MGSSAVLRWSPWLSLPSGCRKLPNGNRPPWKCCVKEGTSLTCEKKQKTFVRLAWSLVLQRTQSPRTKSLFASFSSEKEESSCVIFVRKSPVGKFRSYRGMWDCSILLVHAAKAYRSAGACSTLCVRISRNQGDHHASAIQQRSPPSASATRLGAVPAARCAGRFDQHDHAAARRGASYGAGDRYPCQHRTPSRQALKNQ